MTWSVKSPESLVACEIPAGLLHLSFRAGSGGLPRLSPTGCGSNLACDSCNLVLWAKNCPTICLGCLLNEDTLRWTSDFTNWNGHNPAATKKDNNPLRSWRLKWNFWWLRSKPEDRNLIGMNMYEIWWSESNLSWLLQIIPTWNAISK